MSYRSGRILVVLIWFSLILTSSSLLAQEPERSDIEGVVYRYIKNYFPDTDRTISSIKGFDDINIDEVYLVDLFPEGWFLVSGDKRAEAVLAFSPSGNFFTGDSIIENPVKRWVASYGDQINFIKNIEDEPVSRSWDGSIEMTENLKGEEAVSVKPLIKVTWNQGSGYNIFCPADAAGPGGNTYVGCVAVAMAQAMSVYGYPGEGKGIHSYEHTNYSFLEVNYGLADYSWAKMSPGTPDIYNAMLLYHCAVSVNMNFGPDGSSASTSDTPGALKTHFLYSNSIYYSKRNNYTFLDWQSKILDQLKEGFPLIYRGETADGSSAHAFNIDGVIDDELFHLNWGWGGKNNGYYLLSALSPGTRNYSFDHGAVFNLKPLYYPTALLLSNNIVPENEEPGTMIGTIEIIDEATDNIYMIKLLTDSTLIDGLWVKDYYLDGDILKTGKIFPADELENDTIWFIVGDRYGNNLEVEAHLLFGINLGYENDKDESGIIVYPNPASDYITLKPADGDMVRSITIYSMDGNLVLINDQPDREAQIDISTLHPGTYIIKVQTMNGKVVRRKVIKN
ncbi:MAG: T9SS type A sorting domain-containing protein [Bacteroidia bacterium]|nr:MAG: T9SS type A sorting domain-containing protein [Bacteroidia bacterium]